jgi:uncharacterized phage protein gp47/JayE
MSTYVKKNRADILRNALANLERGTPLKAVGPGSIVRAFTEAVAVELGDMYDAMDYNLSQAVLSTATGASLDLLGELYNVRRKTVTDVVTVNARIGSFYFYVDSPAVADITIPAGTSVYTASDSFIGRQLRYETTQSATILAGRTRVWVSIKPSFTDGVFTAGADSLTVHSFPNPAGVVVKCRNPKPIAPQPNLESDENYRVRIKKGIRVTASGTLDAVRFAGLGIVGVRDIRIKQNIYGMGSFEVMVVPENRGVTVDVMNAVDSAIELVRPVGVRMFLKQPVPVPVDIGAAVVVDSTQVVDNQLLQGCQIAIMRYLNSLLPGEILVFNKLIQAIFDTSAIIKDVQITSFAPNGVEILRRNFTPKEDEQLIPGTISVTSA